MEILINSYEPRPDANGLPASYQIANENYFPYVVNYTYNGQSFIGEASVKNVPPRWKPGETWEVNMKHDDKAAGGVRLNGFSKPHVGGSTFPQQNTTGTPPPQYGSPTPTAVPQPGATNTTAPVGPSGDTYRQAMIIAQSSFKVAATYVSSLNEINQEHLKQSLAGEKDYVENNVVISLANKIARETVTLSKNIFPLI